MDAKLTLTNACGAHCKTCPVWQLPREEMSWETFTVVWDKLMASPLIDRILLNNIGDMFFHPLHEKMFAYMAEHHHKAVIMTTNAAGMDVVPRWVDLLVISFNGGTKESYEYTTGMDFDQVVDNIRKNYATIALRPAEMHCLIWEGNAGTEDAFEELWADFPGKLRISYKYDNQHEEDHTLPEYRKTDRIPCDYLGMLNIMQSGRVTACAHDFGQQTDFGNLVYDTVAGSFKNANRHRMMQEHNRGVFRGICKHCNYNTGIEGKIVYLKGDE